MIDFLVGLISIMSVLIILYLIGIIPYNHYVRDMSLPEKRDYRIDAGKIILTGIITTVLLMLLFFVGILFKMLGSAIIDFFY